MERARDGQPQRRLTVVEDQPFYGRVIPAQEKFKPSQLISHSTIFSAQSFQESPSQDIKVSLNDDTRRIDDVSLSVREQDVLSLYGRGYNNQTIAGMLGKKLEEIDLLVGGIVQKFGVKNPEEAVLASITGGQMNITEFVNPDRKVDLAKLNDEQMKLLGEITEVVGREKQDDSDIFTTKKKQIAKLLKTIGVNRRIEAVIAYVIHRSEQQKKDEANVLEEIPQLPEAPTFPKVEPDKGELTVENNKLDDATLSAYDRYLLDVSEYKKLSRNESILLAKKRDAATSDEERKEAINALVEGNLRLVIWCANKLHYERINKLELVTAGNDGLMKAAEKFDPERGTVFSTLAVWEIRSALDSFVKKALKGQDVISLDTHIHDDSDEITLVDTIADSSEPIEDSAINATEVERILNLLTDREMTILKFVYDGYNNIEIGAKMGISRERIRQLKDRAIKRIKDF